MNSITFMVESSSAPGKFYNVEFIKDSENQLSAYCTCPAGKNGRHCKHRTSILDGLSKGITSNNIEKVKDIQLWLKGTDIENAMNIFKKLEIEEKRVKKELAIAKKAIAHAMHS